MFATNPKILGPSWAELLIALLVRETNNALRRAAISAQEWPRISGLAANIG